MGSSGAAIQYTVTYNTLSNTIHGHIQYTVTYNTWSHTILVHGHMQYTVTYNTRSHKIHGHIQYTVTYNTQSHTIHGYIQYMVTYNTSTWSHAILVHDHIQFIESTVTDKNPQILISCFYSNRVQTHTI